MKCNFCFAQQTNTKLSKEHLLSAPVAEAYGLDRTALLAQFGTDSGEVLMSRAEDVSVRLVCERCNSTWMNALEHRMAAVARWTHSQNRPLEMAECESIRAWSLKTYFVLSAMVGGLRRFADQPEAPGIIPNFTRARQLYEEDPKAFDGMAFGVARPERVGQFAYAFGNPQVVPVGPRYANQKSAGLSVLTLGPLQFWAVDPTLFHSAEIRFPKGVTTLTPGITYGSLKSTSVIPRLEDVIVDNGEHDIVAIFDRLIDWAQHRPAERRDGAQ